VVTSWAGEDIHGKRSCATLHDLHTLADSFRTNSLLCNRRYFGRSRLERIACQQWIRTDLRNANTAARWCRLSDVSRPSARAGERRKGSEARRVGYGAAVKYWESIADNLSKAGFSLGWVSAIDVEGRKIWIVDAHRDDRRRFVVRADEKLTAFVELESATRACVEFF
jgi:hypothetical protein